MRRGGRESARAAGIAVGCRARAGVPPAIDHRVACRVRLSIRSRPTAAEVGTNLRKPAWKRRKPCGTEAEVEVEEGPPAASRGQAATVVPFVAISSS